MSSKNLHVETLTPNVTAFGDRVFKEVIKVNAVMKAGPNSNMTGVLIISGRDTRSMQARGKVI